jgi:CRP/FNR family transcriptional regulator
MNGMQRKSRRGRKTEVGCNHCDLLGFCNLAGLGCDEARLEKIVQRWVPVASDETLVVCGESSETLYAVKSGMFKTVTYTDDGAERVVDFFVPGELIGLDALDCGGYRHTVIAVEDSSVCVMEIQQLLQPPTLELFKDQLIAALVWKLRLDQSRFQMLGAQTADQRLAMFLLDMAQRLKLHGLSDSQFRLSKRRDIASYLGLALETVGRTLKRFEQQGWIETRGRHTCLNQTAALAKLAGVETGVGCQM